ncbi:arginine--tRNA ligase [Patescibacteria group bacterium]|nr:arginine--tRNA ligase [Patescibacteria group bacterium]
MLDLIPLIKQKVSEAVLDVYDIGVEDVHVEHPENMDFGDYAVNTPLVIAKRIGKSPMEIANGLKEHMVSCLEQEKDFAFVGSVEVAPPGFLNIVLSQKYLIDTLKDICETADKPGGLYGAGTAFENKKVIVEYTDPNPFKVFHIGHLMPNVIGESLSRLIQNQGADVKRANYQGDVGVHVAKAIWGLRKEMDAKNYTLEDLEKMPLNNRIDFLGRAYAVGATAFNEHENAKAEMKELNKKIYDLDPEVKEIYEKGRSWSLEYFETLYKRLGTKFDFYYFERETGDQGLKVSRELLEKDVFEKSEGAVVFRGERYGLHTRVFVNSFGLPTYESKDLGLAKTKYEDFPYDLSLIITSNDIEEYFKVVLKALEFIYPEYASKTIHLSHGMLRLKSGKMSSRTGEIISGDELMNKVRDAVYKKMEDKDWDIADKVAIAAIKYGILKNNIGGNIIFDEESWLSLTGDTGPYLQYTYARASSVLEKMGDKLESDSKIEKLSLSDTMKINEDESMILRALYVFPEVALAAAAEYSPNKVCTYLNAVARRYNTFYSNNRILDAEDKDLRVLRLAVTMAVKVVMSNGLWLLGIECPERM